MNLVEAGARERRREHCDRRMDDRSLGRARASPNNLQTVRAMLVVVATTCTEAAQHKTI